MTARRVVLAIAGTTMMVALAAIGWLVSLPQTSARAGLTLMVNLRPRAEVLPGTPLVFDLSISGSPSGPAFDLGSRWRPWHTLVWVEDAGGGPSLPSIPPGAPRSLSLVADAAGRQSLLEDTSPVAHFDGSRHVHAVTFTLGPDATAAMQPGTFRFRAVLETPLWLRWGWTGRVVSAPVTVVIVDSSQAGERREELDVQRLALLAGFHTTAGRFGDAHQSATQLARLRPTEVRSHVLLGDTLAGLNRYTEALDAYRRAMALLPRSYEEPTVLLQRIRRVIEQGRSETAR